MPKGELYSSQVKPHLKQISMWKADGVPEKTMCERLNISVSVWEKYKKIHPELKEALKKGQKTCVEMLRGALIKRALGYDAQIVKTITGVNPNTGKEETRTESYNKHIPPDVTAINLALKNFDKENWAQDPQMLDLKRQELELKKQALDKEDW